MDEKRRSLPSEGKAKRTKYYKAWFKKLKLQKERYNKRLQKTSAWNRTHRPSSEKAREHRLKSLYGISIAEYEQMLKKQKGVCAICGRPPAKQRLAVDHNHKTKQIRGLLCYHCNYGLPWFKTNARILAKAAAYVWRAKKDADKHSKSKVR